MITYVNALRLRARMMTVPLPENVDRADLLALLTAGVRDVLLSELDALAERRAEKSAALSVAAACPWAVLGRREAERRAWLSANPWAARRAV